MTPEEKAANEALLAEIKAQTAEQLKSFNDLFVELKSFKEKDFEVRFKAIEEKSKLVTDEKSFGSLVAELSKLGLEVKSLKETGAGRDRSIKSGSIAETLATNKAKIDAFISNKSGSLQLEHKTGGATETSTDITGRSDFFTWHEGGRVGQIPVRRPFLRELLRNAACGTEYIKYIDQATIVRDAQNVALCGAITSATKVTFATQSLFVDKVKDLTNVCLDMMNDYGFVQSEIQNLLNSSLQLKIDNDLLLGTGVSPILNGIAKYASTFSASATGADYSGKIAFAQLIDLISVAGAQIRAFGKQNMYFPNVVCLNPKDVQLLKSLKDGFGNYIKTPQISTNLFQDITGTFYVDGMKIVENPLVPENEFYIFDSTKGTVYSRPGVGIEFAYENNNNFETDTVTMKVYERLNLLIRNVDANAFLHVADISAGIAAITASGTTAPTAQ